MVSVPNGAIKKPTVKGEKQLDPVVHNLQKSENPADEDDMTADKAFSYIWEVRRTTSKREHISETEYGTFLRRRAAVLIRVGSVLRSGSCWTR